MILVCLFCYFLWNSLYYFPNIVDDAFICFRYAENQVRGEGLVYNPGERIEGFSQLTWVLLEVLILYLGLPPIISMKCLGLFTGIGTLILTFLLARKLFSDQPYGWLKCLITAVVLCFNTSVAIWCHAGLETGLLALILVSMCLRFEVELAGKGSFPFSALLFALAWMSRPEIPVYALYFLVRRIQVQKQRPWSRNDLIWILTAAAVILPYEIWGYWYYGNLLPTTHSAKIGQPQWEGMSALTSRFVHQPLLFNFLAKQGLGLPVMLILTVVGCILGRKRLNRTLWLVPICGLIFVLYAQSDWMPRHRFFVPIMPFISLAVGFGFCEFLPHLKKYRKWVLVGCSLFVLAGADYIRYQAFGGETQSRGGAFAVVKSSRGFWFLDVPSRVSSKWIYPMEQSALILLKIIPPGEMIGLRDIGFPGYLTMNPIWDTAGLVNPVVARARHDQSPEAQQTLFDEILKRRPGCFLLYLGTPPFINDKVHTFLKTDEQAKELYDLVQYDAPIHKKKPGFALYLRKDLPKVKYKKRVRDAAAHLPEYKKRLEFLLSRQKPPRGK